MATEFRVAHLSRVDQQVRELAAKVSQFQIKRDFVQELRTTVERLRVEPKEVGDPIGRTALPGGNVYRWLSRQSSCTTPSTTGNDWS